MMTSEPPTMPKASTLAVKIHHSGKVNGSAIKGCATNNKPNALVKPSVVRPEFHFHRAPARQSTWSQPRATAVTTEAHHSRQPIAEDSTRHGSDHTSIW